MASTDNLFSTSAPTASISVTATTSTPLQLPVNAQNSGTTLRLVNEGPNVCYISTGGSTVVATVPTGSFVNTCTPVLSGSDITLTFGPTDSYIAAICQATQTATLRVSIGSGT